MRAARGLGLVVAFSLVAGIGAGTMAGAAPARQGSAGAEPPGPVASGQDGLRTVPAAPTEVILVQPDGATFSAVPWGIATFNGYEDLDGYNVARDDEGVWRYTDGGEPVGARPDEGDPPAGVEAHDRPPTPPADVLAPSSGSSSDDGPSAAPHTPFTGNSATLVILAEFLDQASVGTTPASWASKYFGATNSVQDYYEEQSLDALHVVPVAESHGTANDGIVGWVKLPRNHLDTGSVNTVADYTAAHATVRDAINAADPYVNFATYDSDHDGVIETDELHIVVITAGYESSYSGEAASCGKQVWGHRWQIGGGYGVTAPTVDGTVAGSDGYMMFGEQHCSTSDTPGHPATMGIMAHELGHDFDFPDLYDIDGTSYGIGSWSLMAGGSWNAVAGGHVGSTPAGLDPFSKTYQQWITPTRVGGTSVPVALQQVASKQIVQLLANPNGVDWNFNVQSGTGEYFLLENRQKVGYDAGLPGCGVLIWHVDETRPYDNTANANGNRRLIDLEEADGLNHLDLKTNRGDAGDPFPGSTGKTSFADGTSPNSKLYSGAASGVSVTVPNVACSATANITVTAPASVPVAPVIGTATAGASQATVTWTSPSDNGGSAVTGYVVTPYIGATAQTPVPFASTATSQVVTGLTNGTSYTFRVAAVNAAGTGPQSASSNAVTPATVPAAPLIGVSTRGNASATVLWKVPASNGGSAVTGYVVTPYIGATAQTPVPFASAATSQVVTGLANGTAYTFRVAAVNAAGTGPQSASSNVVVPNPAIPPAGDFDGNGRTDVAVFRPSNGGWYVNGSPVTYLGLDGDIPVPGDYDGDGLSERAVFRPSTGAWFIEGYAGAFYFGLNGDVPVPGDYDGDEKTDVAVYRPSDGGWYVLGSAVTTYHGLATDVPVPADYDGDGTTDVAVFRPSNGAWFVQGQATTYFGAAGDVPLPGDYDGDGTVESAVFRPSQGAWYIDGAGVTYFGLGTDTPVPGQYDADPATDVAVFRGANGGWYVEGSSPVFFGLTGDVPAPRNPALS